MLIAFGYGYGQKNAKDTKTNGVVKITAETTPLDLARAAYLTQGGEKFRDLKTMVLTGTVDVYMPNSTLAIPSTFIYISARERLRKEVNSAQSFVKQICDGERSYCSLRGISVPPPGKFGMFVLTKFDQPGYSVTALPDKDKTRAFRITDAEGNATDFYVDPANGQVKRQVAVYRRLTYGTEYKKWKSLDGLLVPDSYTEGIESSQGTFYGEYKVKEVKVDQPVSDEMFAMPEAKP
jgi:hypothetical protein